MATPTSGTPKRASMAFMQIPDDAGATPIVQAQVLMQTKSCGEVHFLVQVTDEKDSLKTYFLRTYEEIAALDKRLKDSAKSMGGVQFYGEAASLRAIGELPEAEKFGFRRRMSGLGLSDYNSERTKKLEEYLNSVLGQLPRIRDEPILAKWLGEEAGVLEGGRDAATVAKLKFLLQHLAKQFLPRTPEECESEPLVNLGASVRVVGLQNTTEFNNMLGVVQSHEVDVDKIRKSISGGASPLETSALQTGSYTIQMADGQMAKAKAINVREVAKDMTDDEILDAAMEAKRGGSTPK